MAKSTKVMAELKSPRGRAVFEEKMVKRADDQLNRMGGSLDKELLSDYADNMKRGLKKNREDVGRRLGFRDGDENPVPPKMTKISGKYTSQVTPGKFEMMDHMLGKKK